MELDIHGILLANPVLVLFLILGFGLLIGRVRVAGIELGAVTGVLLIGLLLGHVGLDIPLASHNIGFLLFIYCIGVQAGPQFIRVFRQDGARYGWLALATAVTGTTLAAEAAEYFEFAPGVAAGLLAGAFTSTTALVAAQDALAHGVVLPEGLSIAGVGENIASAYAITYVFGLAGLVVLITVLPRLLKIDVPAEAAELSAQRGMEAPPDPVALMRPVESPSICAYRVERELPAAVYDDDHLLPGEIQKVKRGGEVFTPNDDTRIELGDVVAVVGLQAAHAVCREMLGPEVLDEDLLDRSVESRNIVVTKSEIAGKTLREMEFGGAGQVWLTQLTRSGISMPRRSDLTLQIGDLLLLTGPRSRLDELATQIGQAESELSQTDMVTLAFGIAAGVFLGMVSFKVGEARIGLGSAGGVLLTGLVFGLINSYRPGFGRLPEGARYVLTELGLLLFMAGIAVSAGRDIVETLQRVGPSLVLTSLVVTTVPVIVAFVLGRYVFKMNAALLLGAITGSMTSTAALRQITSQARSAVPMLGYVGTYAFANVLLAFAGGIAIRL